MTISLKLMATAFAALFLFAGAAFAADEIPIPEPASTTLLALGGAGMYLLNRRRRK